MFGGLDRRRSSNVRFKQMFHELKQQFPTIPDEVIANCIIEKASNISTAKDSNIIEVLRSRVTSRSPPEELMGGPSTDCEVPAFKTVDNSDRRASIPEDSPRKKVLEPKKHRKTHRVAREETFESSPEHDDHGTERERRKLSSLLKKTIKTIKSPSKSDHKNHVKKHSRKQHKKDFEDSSQREKSASPRETSASSREASASSREVSVSPTEQLNNEESEHFLTVSALKQHFESTPNGIRERKASPKLKSLSSPPCSDMSKSVDKSNQNIQQQSSPKRPTSLALNLVKLDGKALKNGLQLSEKCKNLPKLLNANLLSDKPPRSPVHNKKTASAKGRNVAFDHKGASSPTSDKEEPSSVTKDASVNTGARKKETVSTPTQTTDTLLGEPTTGSVNLSFNVNCSLDVIQSPVNPRRTSTLQVTPETPFCIREPTSPRSYTTVNLTLRPPSSVPQPPIDITSQNSSLTYSTSSFDSQKGLQKRLQITVGPTGGNVMASRVRPESGDFEVTGVASSSAKFEVPVRSFPDNMAGNDESPVIVKQEKMIDRLRILLINEKTTLEVVRNEVTDLKRKTTKLSLMKQKIAHLRFQCQQLCVDDAVEPEFYNSVYRGQPLAERFNPLFEPEDRLPHQNDYHQQDHDGWNCEMCTFRNHPQMNKCEECDMPRFIHGRRLPRTISVNVLES